MRKGILTYITIVLICAALTGPALADPGYTSVSGIPMAVDFTYRVDFDDAGRPHIVTDYPFRDGATEMNLAYNKGSQREVLTLNYNHTTGETRVRSWNGDVFESEPSDAAFRMIRNGELTQDDHVWINTSYFSQTTDWILEYSADEKNYTAYTERTRAQAFNAMGEGGTERTVYYSDGEISSSRLVKRIHDADLAVEYDEYGEITYASIVKYGPEFACYDYDPGTGLFSGHPITELGYEEADLEIPALAARDTGTESTVIYAPPAYADRIGAGSSATLIGGLLAGIMIGIALFYMFRRKKHGAEEKTHEETDADPGRTDESAGSAGSSETAEAAVSRPPAAGAR